MAAIKTVRDGEVAVTIAAFILSLCAWCSGAFAQAVNYPSRVITIVVGFPAGGATDATTRLIAEKLSEKCGQRVIVENRVGANGLIGTLAVANAAPDGYTLVMGGVNTHGCTTPSSRARVTTR